MIEQMRSWGHPETPNMLHKSMKGGFRDFLKTTGAPLDLPGELQVGFSPKMNNISMDFVPKIEHISIEQEKGGP